jgi:hypothetical protein
MPPTTEPPGKTMRCERRLTTALIAAALLLAAPLAAQVPGHPTSSLAVLVGGGGGDAALKPLPVITLRAVHRLHPEFAFFAEVTQGQAAEKVPDSCFVSICEEAFNGSHRIRMWFVGVETRVAGYMSTDRNHVTIGVGLGQKEIRDPVRSPFSRPGSDAGFAMVVSVSGEIPLYRAWSARAAGSVYMAGEQDAMLLLPNISELGILHIGVSYSR